MSAEEKLESYVLLDGVSDLYLMPEEDFNKFAVRVGKRSVYLDFKKEHECKEFCNCKRSDSFMCNCMIMHSKGHFWFGEEFKIKLIGMYELAEQETQEQSARASQAQAGEA